MASPSARSILRRIREELFTLELTWQTLNHYSNEEFPTSHYLTCPSRLLLEGIELDSLGWNCPTFKISDAGLSFLWRTNGIESKT